MSGYWMDSVSTVMQADVIKLMTLKQAEFIHFLRCRSYTDSSAEAEELLMSSSSCLMMYFFIFSSKQSNPARVEGVWSCSSTLLWQIRTWWSQSARLWSLMCPFCGLYEWLMGCLTQLKGTCWCVRKRSDRRGAKWRWRPPSRSLTPTCII